jgi:hypothetical protein
MREGTVELAPVRSHRRFATERVILSRINVAELVPGKASELPIRLMAPLPAQLPAALGGGV